MLVKMVARIVVKTTLTAGTVQGELVELEMVIEVQMEAIIVEGMGWCATER